MAGVGSFLSGVFRTLALLRQAGALGLAPGPVPLLDLSQIDLTPEPDDLESFAADQSSQATAELSDFDSLLLDPAELLTAPDWGGLSALLDDAEVWTGGTFDADTQAGLADASAAADEGDGSIVGVYEAIPGEAWQPVPDPMQPPGSQAPITWPPGDSGGGGGGEGRTPTD